MPMPLPEYKEKKVDNSSWYLLAIMIGIGIFLLSLGLTKGVAFIISSLIGLAKGRTFYFIVGVVILFLIIRKLIKKKKEEIPKDEYRYT